ncbi:hypothetical protein GQ464_002955 [Rhodocaloribacter litoris]|uniref:hypothetical protein n=1 Tax=Rhodocaloribacter litoris TaxID=2558931 RepID=UPI0014221253|nr:hypothetical protein [Rhodocaloribacter litoris]QXD15923.1 hypothetical protein GQ464_002955 [Rhodocaloribacter litoris]
MASAVPSTTGGCGYLILCIGEGQHFADVDFTGELERLYREVLPCVLLHKDEHIAYNQVLHTGATDELFRDALPDDLLERSRRAAAEAGDRSKHPVLRQRVQRLRALYWNAYTGDPVLQRIAVNVLDDVLARLP